MVIAGSPESRQKVDFAMPSEGATSTVGVLEWRAWDGFLLSHVLGDCGVRIETDPFSKFPSVQFDRICDSFAAVCFQINLSVRRPLPLRTRERESVDCSEMDASGAVPRDDGVGAIQRSSTVPRSPPEIG